MRPLSFEISIILRSQRKGKISDLRVLWKIVAKTYILWKSGMKNQIEGLYQIIFFLYFHHGEIALPKMVEFESFYTIHVNINFYFSNYNFTKHFNFIWSIPLFCIRYVYFSSFLSLCRHDGCDFVEKKWRWLLSVATGLPYDLICKDFFHWLYHLIYKQHHLNYHNRAVRGIES